MFKYIILLVVIIYTLQTPKQETHIFSVKADEILDSIIKWHKELGDFGYGKINIVIINQKQFGVILDLILVLVSYFLLVTILPSLVKLLIKTMLGMIELTTKAIFFILLSYIFYKNFKHYYF